MPDEPAMSFDDDGSEGELSGSTDSQDTKTPNKAEGTDDKSTDDTSKDGEGEKTDPLASLLDGDDQVDPLAALGITPDTAPELTKKAQAFDVVTGLLETNPRLFLDEVEKKFPGQFQKLITEASDRFVAMHSDLEDGPEGSGSKAGKTAPEVTKLQRMVADLQSRLDKSDSKDQQTAEETRTTGLRQQFESKLETLLKHPVLKDLPARDKKAIAALTRQSLSNDRSAMESVTKGNFKDVAIHLKTVVTDWTKDVMDTNKQEHKDRQDVKDRGVQSMTSGAHAAAGEVENDDEGWDKTVTSFADSLLKSQKRK